MTRSIKGFARDLLEKSLTIHEQKERGRFDVMRRSRVMTFGGSIFTGTLPECAAFVATTELRGDPDPQDEQDEAP